MATLNVTIEGGGVVTLDPPGGAYDDGAEVTLAAVPNALHRFDGWAGALHDEPATTTLTVSGEVNVTARFGPQPPVHLNQVREMIAQSAAWRGFLGVTCASDARRRVMCGEVGGAAEPAKPCVVLAYDRDEPVRRTELAPGLTPIVEVRVSAVVTAELPETLRDDDNAADLYAATQAMDVGELFVGVNGADVGTGFVSVFGALQDVDWWVCSETEDPAARPAEWQMRCTIPIGVGEA